MTIAIEYPGIGELRVMGNYTQDRDGAGEPEENFEVLDWLAIIPEKRTVTDLDIDLVQSLCLEEIHRQIMEYDPR